MLLLYWASCSIVFLALFHQVIEFKRIHSLECAGMSTNNVNLGYAQQRNPLFGVQATVFLLSVDIIP